MPAAYDSFNYPSYWIGREYEHKSETIALKEFLSRIRKIATTIEIGTGFGRLVPIYAFRSKKVILTDPSSKLLKIAKEVFGKQKKIKFIHSSLENLPGKIRTASADLIIMVRVVHHIKNLDIVFNNLNRLLKTGGYLVFEFANKKHWKATFREFLAGNFTFPIDINTSDIGTKKGKKISTLPFLNFHPDRINEVMGEYGFEIIEKRSVSNIRSTFLKKIFPTDFLVFLDKITQKPFSHVDFGPSIFILARKMG